MSDAKSVTKKIKDDEIKFVDLRFTDPRGKLQHLTIDAKVMDEDYVTLTDGEIEAVLNACVFPK